jgi:hypothetical protein
MGTYLLFLAGIASSGVSSSGDLCSLVGWFGPFADSLSPATLSTGRPLLVAFDLRRETVQ